MGPSGVLFQGSDGNFYGTTFEDGSNDGGTVFQLTSTGIVTVLFSFAKSSDAATNLVQGSDGNLYGTTYGGGTYDRGYFSS
jgi:uncharacterized repeat protein (TIGR03803 family)